jgi:Ca2+-binding RTX toxin-like protein
MPAQVVERIDTINANFAFPNDPNGAHDLNSDRAPEIVRLADGDFLVLWRAPGNTMPDPDRNPGTGFQRFNADGTPDGAGVYTPNLLFEVVAALPDGFILANGIEWRLFDSTGIYTGGVGQPMNGGLLDIEPLPGGGWVISWTRQEGPGDYDIYVQTFSAAHTSGTPTVVNATPVETATQSDLTVFPDGSYAVSWIDGAAGGDQVMRIWRGGIEAVIDTAQPVLMGEIAALPDGRIIATFAQGQAGGASDVYAAFVAADGTVSTPFLVGNLDQVDRGPRVEVFPDGKFLIVWDYATGAADGQAYGRVYLPDGTPTDAAPFSIGEVNETTGYSIAIVDNDDFVVAWTPGPGTLDRSANATFFHLTTGVDFVGTPNPDSFPGTNADDTASGLGAADTLVGLGGDDLLDGGAGDDHLEGGNGDDTYYVDSQGDTILENLSGFDRVYTSASYTLDPGASIEYLAALDPAGTAPLVLIGSQNSQEIVGNAGNNVLHGGGGGNDLLRGLGGSDVYYTDLSTIGIAEAAGEGNDALYTSASYVLAGGVSVETLSTNSYAATTAINLTGNGFAQTIIGNAGANSLTGGGGADILIGLAGNDVYYVADAAVQIRENEGSGTDTAYASVGYVLGGGAEVEWLEAADTGSADPLSLTGNFYNQTIYGNIGNNVLHGGGGTDVLIGIAGNDVYYVDVAATQVVEIGGGGNDTIYASVSYTLGGNAEVETLSANDHGSTAAINLTGNGFAQTIIGNAGNNILHGGGGTGDLLIGLGGNDIFYVDVGGIAVQIVEAAGGGNDALYTSVGFELRSGIEIELLSANDYASTDPFFITGNEYDQRIVGNAGANALNGGLGSDILIGLGGDDTYNSDGGDIIQEVAGGGNDIVYAYGSSFVLVGAAEVETISGQPGYTTPLDLTGNYHGQTIVGNDGRNVINGGGGTDILRGLLGDDVYYVDVAATMVEELANAGNDALYVSFSYTLGAGNSIERLDANNYGATIAINLTGNEVGQFVTGNAGANTLDGRAGADILFGLGGADNFAFTTALGGGNIDAIADFSVADDTIQLDDAIFAAIGPMGALNPNAFATGAAAADADDRIVYNSATGQLFYDADGNGAGAAIRFASLATGLLLTANDFQVI